jgi:nicotinamide-nucleotide amidase
VAAYSNDVKINLLGVDPGTIKNFGAVSEQTAREMAIGCKKLFGTDYSVSVTGVAGPGNSGHKPAGLVYIALCSDKGVTVQETRSRGNRARIRRAAVLNALDMIRREIL